FVGAGRPHGQVMELLMPLAIRDANLATSLDVSGQTQFTISLTFASQSAAEGTDTRVSADAVGVGAVDGPPVPSGTEMPSSSATRVTELRIEGVNGTPAEVMLNDSRVRKVAGDDEAGFYRPADASVTGPGGTQL